MLRSDRFDLYNPLLALVNHVDRNVDENDEKGKDETGQKPDINIFNVRGSRECGCHGDVEGREDHKGGEVE